MTAEALAQQGDVAAPPPGIDLEAILAPLPGESPTGVSLRSARWR
jgi:hypothetical protein